MTPLPVYKSQGLSRCVDILVDSRLPLDSVGSTSVFGVSVVSGFMC